MKGGTKALILVILILVCVILIILFDVQQYLLALIEWIEGLGFVGRLIYAFVYMLATILFVPGSILTLGSGFLFGLVQGVLVVAVGATLGAVGAFIVGKYFFHEWATGFVAKFAKFQAVYDAIGKKGGKIVFLLRLSPLFPFNASNYIYSLTSVKLIPYTVATFLGILPGVVMYTYFGTLLSSVTTAASRDRTPLEWLLLVVGLLATIGVTVYATRIARQALKDDIS